jgi:hypothetical protein
LIAVADSEQFPEIEPDSAADSAFVDRKAVIARVTLTHQPDPGAARAKHRMIRIEHGL